MIGDRVRGLGWLAGWGKFFLRGSEILEIFLVTVPCQTIPYHFLFLRWYTGDRKREGPWRARMFFVRAHWEAKPSETRGAGRKPVVGK